MNYAREHPYPLRYVLSALLLVAALGVGTANAPWAWPLLGSGLLCGAAIAFVVLRGRAATTPRPLRARDVYLGQIGGLLLAIVLRRVFGPNADALEGVGVALLGLITGWAITLTVMRDPHWLHRPHR